MRYTGKHFQLDTYYPIADCPDTRSPFGIAHNNNHNQNFNNKLYNICPTPLKLLDIGCAGGSSVYHFNRQGNYAMGIDGSPYRKDKRMEEWDKEPDLFTCDATKAYSIYLNNQPCKFDCITAWEILEHIHEKDLDLFFQNILHHLNGYFIGSICVFNEDRAKKTLGVEWGPSDVYPEQNFHHQNMKDATWWESKFKEYNMYWNKDLLGYFGRDVVRGPGILCAEDCTINFVVKYGL